MEKFILPSYNILSDTEAGRAKGVTLFGEAQQFLFQTNLYMKKYPYFQRRRLLEDGSVLTVQKVNRRDYRVYIEPFIPIEEEEETTPESLFYLAINKSSHIVPSTNSNNTSTNQQIMLISVDQDNNIVSGKKLPSKPWLAGNIDWNYEWTWHGHIKRDGFVGYEQSLIGGNLLTRDSTGFPDKVFQEEFLNSWYGYFSRYTTQIFKNGEVYLDTSDNNSESVLGYAFKNGYDLVITFTDKRKDTVWRVRDGVWLNLGSIQYVEESDNDNITVGRNQCVTFSPDGTKFTGVVVITHPTQSQTNEDTYDLVEGEVLFDSSGAPTGITTNHTRVEYLMNRGFTIEGLFSENGSDFTRTYVIEEEESLVQPVPLASAYKLDNTLNVLYLLSRSRQSTNSDTQERIIGSNTTTFTNNNEFLVEASWHYTASGLNKLITSTNNSSMSGTETNTFNQGITASMNSTGETSISGISWFDYVDLKNEIYIYTDSSYQSSGSRVGDLDTSSGPLRDGIGTIVSSTTETLSNPDLFFNNSSLLSRDGYSTSDTSTIIIDSSTKLNNFLDGIDLFDRPPENTLNPDNPVISDSGSDQFFGRVPDEMVIGVLGNTTDVPEESTFCATDSSGVTLVSHKGYSSFGDSSVFGGSSGVKPFPVVGDSYFVEARIINSDGQLIPVDWDNIYSSQELLTQSFPRVWHTTSIFEDEIAIGLTTT